MAVLFKSFNSNWLNLAPRDYKICRLRHLNTVSIIEIDWLYISINISYQFCVNSTNFGNIKNSGIFNEHEQWLVTITSKTHRISPYVLVAFKNNPEKDQTNYLFNNWIKIKNKEIS